MKLKKILYSILFPPLFLMLLLLPLATALLVYAMVFVGTDSILAYVSYPIAAYTLTVWCFKIPHVIRFFKTVKTENQYVRRWLEDARLRMNVSLYGSLIFNIAYATFQLWLGLYHGSFWFYSMAGYYTSLAVMRFFLVRYTRKHVPGVHLVRELVRYRACGIVLLAMNLALSLMVFFMVYFDRTFVHHEITTIVLATYTFTAFTFAVIDIVKNRQKNSPVYSASSAVRLAAACVSMLTLASTMMTTFGKGTMALSDRRLFLLAIGGTVVALTLLMAIYMIVYSTKRLKNRNFEERNHG